MAATLRRDDAPILANDCSPSHAAVIAAEGGEEEVSGAIGRLQMCRFCGKYSFQCLGSLTGLEVEMGHAVVWMLSSGFSFLLVFVLLVADYFILNILKPFGEISMDIVANWTFFICNGCFLCGIVMGGIKIGWMQIASHVTSGVFYGGTSAAWLLFPPSDLMIYNQFVGMISGAMAYTGGLLGIRNTVSRSDSIARQDFGGCVVAYAAFMGPVAVAILLRLSFDTQAAKLVLLSVGELLVLLVNTVVIITIVVYERTRFMWDLFINSLDSEWEREEELQATRGMRVPRFDGDEDEDFV